MYPDPVLGDLTLYEIFVTVGLVAALVILRVLGDKAKMPAKVENFFLIDAAVSIALGFLFAVLFQAVYNALETGKFALNSGTGMTFLGGLLGGIGTFFAVYALAAKTIFKNGELRASLGKLLAIAPCSITAAHGFGRIGCLMAGCCYGRVTSSWIGVAADAAGKRVPIQLFEAVFLFALCAALIVLELKGFRVTFPIYFVVYGIWRFVIEFFRDDDRGAFFIPGVTPSQGISILLVIVGAAWLAFIFIKKKPIRDNAAEREHSEENKETEE